MLIHRNFRSLPAIVLAAFSSMVATATTVTFSTAPGAQSAGENVNASAQFTSSAGEIDIVLSNLLTAVQVHSVGGNISDLMFTVSNNFAGTVNDSNRSYSGTLVDVNDNKTVSAAVGTLNGWDFSNTGSHFTLEELGSAETPSQTIIGGPGATSYANSDGSIYKADPHSPFLQGSATFRLVGLTGVTANTTITAATFSFGTTLGANVIGHDSVVPEPKEAAVVLLGFLAVFIAHRRRNSHSKKLA